MGLVIGIIARDFQSIGGFQSYTETLVEELLDQGHCVHVLSSSRPPAGLVKKGVRFVVDPAISKTEHDLWRLAEEEILSKKTVVSATDALRQKVTRFFDQFESDPGKHVVFFVSIHRLFFLGVSINVILECAKRKIPLVSREASELHFFKYRKVEETVLSCPNRIVVPSLLMKKWLTKKKVSYKKIRLVHNGISKDFFSGFVPRFSKQLRILFPGRVFPRVPGLIWDKGIGDLLFGYSKIASEFPDSVLIFGGFDPTNKNNRFALNAIRQFAKNCGIESRIRFLSVADSVRKDFLKQYRRADMVVCNSQYPESYLNTVWEAMAMQKPVVTTTRAISVMEAIHPKEVFLAKDISQSSPLVVIPLSHPNVLAEVLHRLLSDFRLRNRIGKNGKKLAKKRVLRPLVKELVNVLESTRGHPNKSVVQKIWDSFSD